MGGYFSLPEAHPGEELCKGVGKAQASSTSKPQYQEQFLIFVDFSAKLYENFLQLSNYSYKILNENFKISSVLQLFSYP